MPMMTLGDFFKSAPYARPVNPRAVTFTAVSRNEILPGGQPNPHKRPTAATVKAAMVFIGGDGALSARVDARTALEARGQGLSADSELFWVELTYQLLWRSLCEYDDKEGMVGNRLFPDVGLLRELVEVPEADRLLKLYNEYVEQEHAEGAASPETFRKSKG